MRSNNLAWASRERSRAKIVGVTGSVANRTKEALFAALGVSAPGRAHRSVKSYNNMSRAIEPVGCRRREIRRVRNGHEPMRRARRADPHRPPPCRDRHHDRARPPRYFASDAAIADAKGEIFQVLTRGTAIIPHDSPHRDRLIAAARLCAARILPFGLDEDADSCAPPCRARPRGGSMVRRACRRQLTSP